MCAFGCNGFISTAWRNNALLAHYDHMNIRVTTVLNIFIYIKQQMSL